MTFHLETLLTT